MSITLRFFRTCFFLCCIAAALASCGTEPAAPQDPSVPSDTAVGSYTETNSVKQRFPEITFEGREIRFLTEECELPQYTSIEIYAAASDGSLINDTVFQRNMKIEEQFDVKITEERLRNAASIAHQTVLTDDASFDVVMPYMNSSAVNAMHGDYHDLYSVEYLQLEEPWWDARANENLQIGGKLYFTTGDISILDNDCTMVWFFNKKFIEKFDLESPYQLVQEGRWTIDQLFRMAKSVSADLDGDGKYTDTKDRFGLFCASNVPHSLFYGTGERILASDANGNFSLVMKNERSAEVLSKIFDACLDPTILSGAYETSLTAFLEERLFFAGWALTDINAIRDASFDFGILPYPKYDTAQSAYYNLISTSLVPGVSIPITNQEPATAGLILEAMAYYSTDTLTKAYYETALNNRYIRDTESAEMLDIIFASRVYDFGYIFDIGGLGQLISTMYGAKNKNFSSMYETRESKAQTALQELSDTFAQIDNMLK